MDLQASDRADHPALRLLEGDESVEVLAEAESARLLVTDRRLVVASDERVVLDVGFDGLRRIQFDIERSRPATFVIVPEHAANEPQVLAIPPERYDEITRALAVIGRRLAETA
jgi:hypothetical protein